MNQTPSIIVYRNPVEQAFWGNIPGIVMFCVVLIVMVLINCWIAYKVTPANAKRKTHDTATTVALFLALAQTVAVFLAWPYL